MAQTLAAMSQRLVAAESHTQQLAQALNNTQRELQSSQAASFNSTGGLPKGVKTWAPDRFSGRPTASYPTTQHFLDFALRYMRVGGVSTSAQIDYVTLHLSEGEARTWYDLRAMSIVSEDCTTFASALKAHFANHNSQRHYREAIQFLHMRQCHDAMEYNQAFRQMLLCSFGRYERD